MIQEILEYLLVSDISIRASTCTLTTGKLTDFNCLTVFWFCSLCNIFSPIFHIHHCFTWDFHFLDSLVFDYNLIKAALLFFSLL